MSDVLANDLNISGVFRPLDKKGFLEDPQVNGLEASEIKFPDWSKQGADFLARCSYQVQGYSVRLDGPALRRNRPEAVGNAHSYSGRSAGVAADGACVCRRHTLMLTGERGVFDTKIAYVQVSEAPRRSFTAILTEQSRAGYQGQTASLCPLMEFRIRSQIAYVSYRDGKPISLTGGQCAEQFPLPDRGFPGLI